MTNQQDEIEQLAEVLNALREADNLLSQYSINPQDQEAIENIQSLLQSSTPAEPQAGVELTDEEIKAAFIEAHGGDAAYYDSHGYEIRWTARTVQRAINQRQAVKTEPAIQALAMIGEVLGLDDDDAGPTPIIEKIVCLQEAFETVKRLHLIATNQVVDLRKAAKPEPLSAAQAQTAVALPEAVKLAMIQAHGVLESEYRTQTRATEAQRVANATCGQSPGGASGIALLAESAYISSLGKKNIAARDALFAALRDYPVISSAPAQAEGEEGK